MFLEELSELFGENWSKFLTAGYLVFWKQFPAAGYLDKKTNKMADLPFPQIRAKKFRQQEIDLDQFTDEELIAVDTGLAESQFNSWKKSSRTTSRAETDEEKTEAVANVVTTSCNKFWSL